MSPRKNNILTVEAWPNPRKGKLYKGIVKKADVDKKAKCLHVTIENLDPTQLGRIHEMDLPLPVRPSRNHKTCAFLMACGIDATVDGVSIDLNEIAGVTIGMRFGAVAEDRSQRIDFERIEDPSRVQANTPGGDTEGAQLGGSTPKSEAEGGKEF